MTAIAVLQSATSHCQVCDGHGVLHLVQLLGFPAVGRVNCPHCRPGPRAVAAPIPPIPYRDIPRSTGE